MNKDGVFCNFFVKLKILLRPRCALLLSVVGTFNKDYEENASARHIPKFASQTSHNPDVIFN